MRVFKNKSFDRFARKAAIPDSQLCTAAEEINAGRFNADLGQGVYKQRIARVGSGKSGGFRVVVILKVAEVAFFIHGFAKSDIDNLTLAEVRQLKKLARHMLALGQAELSLEVSSGLLIEVSCNDETVS